MTTFSTSKDTLNQSHLIIRNSPVVETIALELREVWEDAVDNCHPNYEPIEDIFLYSARWGDDHSQIVRHRETDILFDIKYREGDGDWGENDLHSITPVVATKQVRTVYDIEDANGNTLHESIDNGRFEELV